MLDLLRTYFKNYGANKGIAEILAALAITFFLLLISILAHFILKKVILRIVTKIIKNNKLAWDDILLERKVIQRVLMMVPGIIIYSAAILYENKELIEVIQRLATTYVLIIMFFVISSVLNAIDDIYRTKPISKLRPIKGFLQVVKIIAYIVNVIIIIANLLDKSPLLLLSSIGALTAVFSFVFKDSILGFIAGIQLTSNDMLRIGDWIDMPKYGADGDVIDITLNTVKVQNFDKTIVTIPAYALISDSFKNWRGMQQFGGRRIKRSIYIDVNTICFCTPEMIEKFKKIHYLEEYISEKEKEIEEYNIKNNIDTNQKINGRRMTNIGTFRVYLQNYINNHPGINQEKITMVRQLAPDEKGLPLEIYGFTKDTIWVNYERVQADIFDHIFAVAGEFGLRIYQKPSGYDIRNATCNDNLNDINKKVN
ncbi:mechanosensitive ion channel family protein [Herbinix luporum]|nr:mechanosensitive ion channel domain-containing protein [Herbinix luporum]MDI9489692.1 mechanosensitive ion channel [Bacillota bacterium]HHT56067.1 mechanosensitive ion channel [Herbinix luporum]